MKSIASAPAIGPADALVAMAATSWPIVVTDPTRPDNPITYMNAAFGTLYGYSEAEIVGRNCDLLHGVDTDPVVLAEIAAAVGSGVGIRREILNYRRNGEPFWIDLTMDPIHDAYGRLTGYVAICADLAGIHRADDARTQLDSKLQSVASDIPGYIFRRVMRTDGTIDLVYCSPSLGKLLGLDDASPLRSLYDHIHPADRDRMHAAILSSADSMSIFREEIRMVSTSGDVRWFRSEAQPRQMPNGEIIWDGLALEISAEKRWQTEIAQLARHDPLTGLLTREAWRQAVTGRIASVENDASCYGLVHIDIQAFSSLNHRFGHDRCDNVLRELARRIASITASLDGVCGRVGGDEFAMLAPISAHDDALPRLAADLEEALGRPIIAGGQSVTIRLCIGAALLASQDRPDTPDPDVASELMTQAELALHWSKRSSCRTQVIYSAAQDDRVRNRGILAQTLERAIQDGEMELHYQPLVDLASGRVVSAEALVRWNHPTLGLLRPDLFIPLAETSGLIVELGRWVLEEAIRQRKLWADAGLATPSISVNVSGNQLREPGFVEFAAAALERLGGHARDFELELTESQIIEATQQTLSSLHMLRNMGFTIVIDDFGTGNATFRYLREFPVDKVKIDQLFVRKLVVESNDALIIRAVISLSRSMGIGFVAEGIETEMQRQFLQREGCMIGQGYLFSIPLVAEDFAWMLANNVTLPLLDPAPEVPS
ncbi:EAL domain-containing protein [Lichenicola sp.]|uniref:sensor domain-containing protein n=1 Tax=Lichenicola sp. TaxID=2804529 RepID=UPI003B00F5CA